MSGPLTDQPAAHRLHRSARFVVALETSAGRHKMLQIGFLRSDGSVYVAFPYYENTDGVVAVATYPAGAGPGISIDLTEAGRVTSHRVKFSHHASGEALFSQTGKVSPDIRRQSIPLAHLDGHLFTIQLQGPEGFAVADPTRDAEGVARQRSVVGFRFSQHTPSAIKILGRWHPLASLVQAATRPLTPVMGLRNADGVIRPAFLLASPEGWPLAEHVLVLTCQEIPSLTEDPSCLTMIGGFDPVEIVHDHSRDSSFLAMSYPTEGPEDLRKRIGSIDIESESKEGDARAAEAGDAS